MTSRRADFDVAISQYGRRRRTPPPPEVIQDSPQGAAPICGCDPTRVRVAEALSSRLGCRVPQPNGALHQSRTKPGGSKGSCISQAVPGSEIRMRAPAIATPWGADDSHVGRDRDLPSTSTRARANVEIVEVHEEALVEASHFLQRRDSPHHRRSIDCGAGPNWLRNLVRRDTVSHLEAAAPGKASRVSLTVRSAKDGTDHTKIGLSGQQRVELLHRISGNANVMREEEHELRAALQGKIDAGIHTPDVPAVSPHLNNASSVSRWQSERFARVAGIVHENELTAHCDRLSIEMIEQTGSLITRSVCQDHHGKLAIRTLGITRRGEAHHCTAGRVGIGGRPYQAVCNLAALAAPAHRAVHDTRAREQTHSPSLTLRHTDQRMRSSRSSRFANLGIAK
jgi:hypothetical protein